MVAMAGKGLINGRIAETTQSMIATKMRSAKIENTAKLVENRRNIADVFIVLEIKFGAKLIQRTEGYDKDNDAKAGLAPG